MARANAMLDRALISYVTALRSSPSGEWQVVDRAAVPATPSAETAAGPSRGRAVARGMDRCHAVHAPQLCRAAPRAGFQRRCGAIAGRGAAADQSAARARFLPADGRYVLVNTAAQQLYMYENGQVVDWMRVVVGKPAQPTPMMAAMIRFTAVNPYWNVPARPRGGADRTQCGQGGPRLPEEQGLCRPVRLER